MANAYSDQDITTLSMCEQMRLRPSMWGFPVANIEGPLIQIKEVYDNAADEALDPKKVYPIDITFFVSRDKSTYQCMVRDHGRGIPVAKLASCFTTSFTSGKYRGTYGGASSGTNGVGSKAAAAFSVLFMAFTNRYDGFGYLKVSKGIIQDDQSFKKPADKDPNSFGTLVLLQPDPSMFAALSEMFGNAAVPGEPNGFAKHLSRMEMTSLFRGNVLLTIRTVDGLLTKKDLSREPAELWKFLTNLNNFKTTVAFQTDMSISQRQYVINKFGLSQPLWELTPIHKSPNEDDEDPLGLDIDIFVDEKSIREGSGIIGAVNYTPINHPDSSHISMLQTVLKEFLDDNVEDPDAKAFFESRYRIPFSGTVFATWVGAEFIGQDKSRFENRQFAECYRQYLRRQLKVLTEQQGEGLWDRLWELIQEHFVNEFARFSKRSLGISKNLKNMTYDLRRKDSFRNCVSQDNRITELIITEGDSAAGRVETERDENIQAVLKLSGKPINPIRCDKKRLDANAIYCDLQQILCVTSSDTNLDNMRFSKIVIMTDADPDGYHIVVLILAILYRINRLIIDEGRVVVTCPPLYSFVDKRLGAVYLRDEAALRDSRITVYRTLLDIDLQVRTQNKKGKWIYMNNAQHVLVNKVHDAFRDLCILVEEIGSTLVQQAELLNIPYLELEQLLHVIDCLDESNVNTKEIVKRLGLTDAIWMKEDNVLVLVDEQEVEHRIPLPRLQRTLKNTILPKYEIGNWDKVELFVSTKYSDLYQGTPCTYAMLYRIFKDLDKLFTVRRFKGLGEMSAAAIKKTCIDPQERSFVTIKTVGDVTKVYEMLGVDTDARKKLVNRGFVEE